MDGADLVVFHLGPLAITGGIVTTWGIMVVLTLLAWFGSTRLRVEDPGRLQVSLEGVVLALRSAIDEAVAGADPERLLPFIGSLWVYLVIGNLAGIVPGLDSPTASLSTTAGLALLVFFAVHWYGIRTVGLRRYLGHYLTPSPVLLPFHVISELTRTLALAVRLFGNMMSLEMAALLVLLVAGFLVPVPVLMLHIIEALVQAYIFGMLALVYIGSALQSHQQRIQTTQQE